MELIHGGDLYTASKQTGFLEDEIIDFSANINPLGMPQGIKERIIATLDTYTNYPDPRCRHLRTGLSDYHDIDEGHIICGNGAADIIFRLIHAIYPGRGLVLAPTFSEYELALKSVGAKVDYYDLDSAKGFQLDEGILKYLTEDIDIVFICNPNNPTGQLIDRRLMLKMLQRCEKMNILLVVDECFNEFIENPTRYSVIDYIVQSKYLFVLKAFTKIYAIPGIRLGYGLSSDHKLLEKMYQCAQAWSVSGVAMEAGIAALKEDEYVRDSLKLIHQQRTYLKQELKRLEFEIIGSYANYIFFKSPYVKDLKEALLQDGILIRSCSNYRGLDDSYYRVAVKNRKDNERLIMALKNISSP